MFLVKLWCFLLLIGQSHSIAFNDTISNLQLSAASCVKKLAVQHFEPYSTISFVKTRQQYRSNYTLAFNAEDLVLEKLVQMERWTLVMKLDGVGGRKIPEFGFEKIHNYVIIFQELIDLKRVLVNLSGVNSWNPHAKFLLFIVGFIPNQEPFMAELLQVLWDYWIVNVVIFFPAPGRTGHLMVTYFPFSEGHCGRQDKNYTVIGTCVSNRTAPEIIDFYPEKVPKDMHNCLVKVGTHHSPPFVILNNSSKTRQNLSLDNGIEMALMKTIAEAANFDVELSISYLMNHHEDTTDSASEQKNATGGLLKELAARNLDIAIGTISPTIAEHRRFDFSVQYTQDMATWIVPSDSMLPQWIGLLLVFQPTAYAATFLLLVFLWLSSSAIVRLVAFNFRREHRCYKYRGSFLLITVGILLANIPDKFPRTRFLKSIVFIWTLFCFYWNTAYNATLMSVVTNTVYREGIETEQQIIDSGLNMLVTNRTMLYFTRFVGPNGTEFGRGHTIFENNCKIPENCLLDMSRERNSALAMSRNHFEFVRGDYRDINGNYHLKALKTNIATAPIEMLLSKGNPLLPRVNEILLSIIESGLIEYWKDIITRKRIIEEREIKSEKTLTLNYLQAVFILQFVGLLISGIVFIMEILHAKYVRTYI